RTPDRLHLLKNKSHWWMADSKDNIREGKGKGDGRTRMTEMERSETCYPRPELGTTCENVELASGGGAQGASK
ncbi:hypothetical protein KUCAC02_022293, partial [Chaenocephalus aceratus]